MHKKGKKREKKGKKREIHSGSDALAAKEIISPPAECEMGPDIHTLMTQSATQQLKVTARNLMAHLNTYLESKQSFSRRITMKSITLNQSNCCNYDALIQAESRRDTPAN